MILTQPIQYFCAAASAGHLELEDAATESWTVAPAEQAVVQPAATCKMRWPRVTGVGAFSTMEHQMEIIRGGPVTHNAIRAFVLENAALLGRECIFLPLSHHTA